jgi:hypothetical protein
MGTKSGCEMDCNTCKDDASTIIAQGTGGKTWEFFQYSSPLTTVGGGLSVPVAIPTFPDSYMVIKKLFASGTVSPLAIAGNAFTVLIYNSATGRTLQNIPINAFNCFGGVDANGLLLPANLKDPIILPPSSNIQIQLTDLSGAPNSIQLGFSGYRWFNLAKPPVVSRSGRRLEWFQQAVNVVLPSNGQTTQQIRIDADADFLVRKIMTTRTYSVGYNVQISDSSSKDTWTDLPQNSQIMAGNAPFPYWLPKPKLLAANSSIGLNFTDLGGGGTFQFVLEGAKVYR